MADAFNDSSSTALDHFVCSPSPLWMRIVALVATVIGMTLGTIGNISTLLSFAISAELRVTANVNIFCLTIVDLLGVYVYGQQIEKYWLGCFRHSPEYCHVFQFFSGVTYFGSQAFLALVAYDRYLMVKHGLRYKQTNTLCRVLICRTIPFGIVYAAFIGFLCGYYNLLLVHSELSTPTRTLLCLPQTNAHTVTSQLMTRLGLLVPLGVMVFSYVSVHRRCRKNCAVNHNNNMPDLISCCDSTSLQNHNISRRSKENAKTIVWLLGALVVTSTPFTIAHTVQTLGRYGVFGANLDMRWWNALYEMTFPVAWLNNAVNPFLYAHAMPKFRRAMRRIWHVERVSQFLRDKRSKLNRHDSKKRVAALNSTADVAGAAAAAGEEEGLASGAPADD